MKTTLMRWMRMSVVAVAVCIAALALVPLSAVAQGTGVPPFPAWTFARDYGQWAMTGQSANTYVFFGRSTCNQNAPQNTFFPFSTNATIFIQDVGTPSLSEVVTPTGIVQSGSTCGVTVSPANFHYSFQLRSGTAGLQEALNTIGTPSTRLAIVYLDTNWWAQAALIPNTTPQAILYNAIGSTGVVVVDLTTSPYTVYQYQNGHYQTSGAATGYFNQNVASLTQIAAPAALTLATATTGGTIPATSTYRLAATYVDASGGETLISSDSSSTVTTGATATNTISATSPAAVTGAVGWRLYMTAAGGGSGSEILYTPSCTLSTLQSVLPGVCAIGSTATVSAVVTGTATIPALNLAYPRTTGSSFAYVPYPALGALSAGSAGTIGAINFPAGYFNALGKTVQVCANGNATTNATPGTLTISESFLSVPGMTVVPWSVTSGTTTASAVVPFNFCETITTTATGTAGTLEVHGCIDFGLAGTSVVTSACDTTTSASSAVDLTRAAQLAFRISPTTTSLTASQLRQTNLSTFN